MASKFYKSYVLNWLKSEVSLCQNQYSGVRGTRTENLLVQMWQKILENDEDYRASKDIMSIDYSKAFYRMSFHHCLRALAKNEGSTTFLEIISTFLRCLRMTVKVKKRRKGCLQGSILGVFD